MFKSIDRRLPFNIVTSVKYPLLIKSIGILLFVLLRILKPPVTLTFIFIGLDVSYDMVLKELTNPVS